MASKKDHNKTYFDNFRGIDTGIDEGSVSLHHSPDMRNWVHINSKNTLHGPRKGSEDYGNFQLKQPVKHIHSWFPRGGVPINAVFSEGSANVELSTNPAYEVSSAFFSNGALWDGAVGEAMTAGVKYFYREGEYTGPGS